jgi:hypothetical protein
MAAISLEAKTLDQYVTVPEKNLNLVLDIVKLFDGNHSIDDIKKSYPTFDINRLFQAFYEKGLLSEPKNENIKYGEFKRHTNTDSQFITLVLCLSA